MAIRLENGSLLMIRAMLRDHYRRQYKEVRMAEIKTPKKNPRTKAGEEITPEIAAALAAEAECGYDLPKAKRRRVVRPLLAGQGASPRMSFRTTPDLYYVGS